MALTGLLLLAAASSEAQQVARQVLLLQSVDRGNLPIDQFTGNFRVELDKRAEEPVNVVQVVVGPTGFIGASEQAVVDYIRSAFSNRPKPDLIVSIAGPAAVFARRYRPQLFPDTPTLFASVDQRYLGDAPLGADETAVAVVLDYPRAIEHILQLLPQTKRVFMVMGSGQLGQFWHRELEDAFRRFHDRLTFVWFDNLSLQEMLRRCASLPDNSAIFYLTFGTDATGAAYADDRVVAELHAQANAPLFAALSVYLGAGIVGGSLMSIDEHARTSADTAIRLLNGAAPASINVPPQLAGQPIFDWRELQRWGIPESRLPAGSVVLYRAPSVWREYKFTVLSAAGALIIQSLLIGGLLYQRRARQRAEIQSRRNLALAADASRRVTMSTLTSSIAHELTQPLSSMIHNAQAGRMMLTANRATPDTVGEILSDIESEGVQATQIIDRHRTMLRNHRLDMKPIDLHAVVHDSLALVAHDLRSRQIEATVNLSSSPCVITGDPVLLQQVLVNLVMNAMDAMAETPPRVVVSPSAPKSKRPMSKSRCATPERAYQRISTASCSHHSSQRKRTASGSDLRSRERSSTRMVALLMRITIPKGARHSLSPCAAAKHPRSCQARRVVHDIPRKQHGALNEQTGRDVVHCMTGLPLDRRPRVLLAEDHPGMAKAVCRVLALDCDVVGSVADGSAVLEAAQRLQPDVIVIDLNLPHVHGLEACRQITQANPETQVIVFSAMNDPDVTQRSFEVGASAFVSKGTGDLLSTIKRLCDDRG